MKQPKIQDGAIPATVPCDEFTRIMGKLASMPPEKRKDIRAGEKKRQGRMIQPKPDSDQR